MEKYAIRVLLRNGPMVAGALTDVAVGPVVEASGLPIEFMRLEMGPI